MKGVCCFFLAVACACCTHGGRDNIKRPPGLGPANDPIVDEHGNVVAPPPPPPKIVTTEETLELTVDDQPIVLGARFVVAEGAKGPGIVIVPGGGDVSRDGTRKGDGVVVYPAPVDTGVAWSEAFAKRGAVVLTYDKRTCGPNDVPGCKVNPQKDIDDKGPVALAADVDAACAKLKQHPSFDGRLVLWAHGQAAQVALSSACAKEAAGVVLLSPIPRTIDAVLVDALLDRQAQGQQKAKEATGPEKDQLTELAVTLKNDASTRAAEFSSMKGGKFAKDAKVRGATISFWLGWMDLTGKTPALLAPVQDKVVVVVGAGDLQMGKKDREAAQKLPAKKVLVVEADHHLLVHGALDETVVRQIADAVDVVIGVPQS